MNKQMLVFLTLLLCCLLQGNFIYAQDNFIEVIDNKSIKFSKEGQEKLNRVKNQKLYQEPKIVQFRDIENVIKENKLEFVLPNYSCKLSFTYQNGEYEDKNNYHWYGTLHNEKQKNCYDGSILFVKKDGEIFGTINIDETSYEFMEIEKGYQMLYKVNPTEKALCGNASEETNPKEHFKKNEPIDQHDLQRIECVELAKVRILVLYTSAGAASVPNITATTNLATQQMKTALSNSSVSKNDLDIEIAAILPLSFTETNDIEKDLKDLAINSSAQSLRNTHQADLVVLMTDNVYDGLGRVNGIGAGFSTAYAIVTAQEAAGSYNVFAHEVGHLLGGRHDSDPSGTIEHGYCFRNNIFSTWQNTVMAAGPNPGVRILHYSNPNRYYNGKPTGTNNENYVAQHFRNSGRQVAAYYPNTPGNFYATIIGSFTPCPWQENWYEADIRCGTPPFNIQWHTSTNGINYIYRTAGEFYLFQAPMQSGTATTIRMTVTGSNGVSQTRYIQTTSYSPPNSLSCEGGSNNGFRIEAESKIVAKVSPNPIEGSAKLYIELPKEDTQIQILIVDTFGKTIQTLDTSNFLTKGEFDITGLTTGLYYVSIRSEINGLYSITIHVK
jgi:hypothetical protein